MQLFKIVKNKVVKFSLEDTSVIDIVLNEHKQKIESNLNYRDFKVYASKLDISTGIILNEKPMIICLSSLDKFMRGMKPLKNEKPIEEFKISLNITNNDFGRKMEKMIKLLSKDKIIKLSMKLDKEYLIYITSLYDILLNHVSRIRSSFPDINIFNFKYEKNKISCLIEYKKKEPKSSKQKQNTIDLGTPIVFETTSGTITTATTGETGIRPRLRNPNENIRIFSDRIISAIGSMPFFSIYGAIKGLELEYQRIGTPNMVSIGHILSRISMFDSLLPYVIQVQQPDRINEALSQVSADSVNNHFTLNFKNLFAIILSHLSIFGPIKNRILFNTLADENLFLAEINNFLENENLINNCTHRIRGSADSSCAAITLDYLRNRRLSTLIDSNRSLHSLCINAGISLRKSLSFCGVENTNNDYLAQTLEIPISNINEAQASKITNLGTINLLLENAVYMNSITEDLSEPEILLVEVYTTLVLKFLTHIFPLVEGTQEEFLNRYNLEESRLYAENIKHNFTLIQIGLNKLDMMVDNNTDQLLINYLVSKLPFTTLDELNSLVNNVFPGTEIPINTPGINTDTVIS